MNTITAFCDLAPMQSLPIEIQSNRNSMRGDLLNNDQARAIKEVCADVAKQYEYT